MSGPPRAVVAAGAHVRSGTHSIAAAPARARSCARVPCPAWYYGINFVLLGLVLQHIQGAAYMYPGPR